MSSSNINRRAFLHASSLLAAGLAAGSSLPQSASAASQDQPNIIWLIADDIGWRELGCYGHPTIRTPNIDKLAQNGIRFTSAFVNASSCSPSRCSMFTGKHPHSTGAENLHDSLPADQAIVPELLAPMNYYSGNAGKFHMGDSAAQRFDVLYNDVNQWGKFFDNRPKNKPFFLYMGFHDAHRPFDRGCIDEPYTHDDIVVPPYLPDIPEAREELAGFYDEITRMDSVIGDILARLEKDGELDNTIILFCGDNGMPFPRAKCSVYDSGIETPLIMQWPKKIKPGQVNDNLVSLIDAAPTTLEYAGVSIPSDMQGHSLVTEIDDPSLPGAPYIYAEKNWHDLDDHSRAVRDHRYKYIRNAFPEIPLENSADSSVAPLFQKMRQMRDEGTLSKEAMLLFRGRRAPEELYDLSRDPWEFKNLVNQPAYQTVLKRMRQTLDQWIKETKDIPPSKALPNEFHPETGERIAPPHQNMK